MRSHRPVCNTCHGPKGKGDGPAGAGLQPPPADLTDPTHARFYTDAGRVEILRSGSPGTAMAGFGELLSEKELLDLYAFVRTLREEAEPKHEHDGHHGY
ncbi:MAG: c-type cytochrome [Myxococcota bacterium]